MPTTMPAVAAIQYASYRDGNGVTWSIYETTGAMLAYVRLDSEVQYAEEPADLQTNKPSLEEDASSAAINEGRDHAFTRLRKLIDDYAAAHKSNVILRVVPPKDSTTALLVIAAITIALLARRR